MSAAAVDPRDAEVARLKATLQMADAINSETIRAMQREIVDLRGQVARLERERRTFITELVEVPAHG